MSAIKQYSITWAHLNEVKVSYFDTEEEAQEQAELTMRSRPHIDSVSVSKVLTVTRRKTETYIEKVKAVSHEP